jgi:PAS domain S-box-containing protein
MRPALRRVMEILALAGIYFCAGKLGLSLAYVHASVSVVWPASGIALAALLLWQYRLWPGIFFGALLVNITTFGSLASAIGIAAGNTLEALVGAWAIIRFANGAQALERARDSFKFVLLGPVLSTILGATVGVASLILAGFAEWDRYPSIWITWWLGDAVGDLIVAPLILIWLTQSRLRITARRIAEALGLLCSLLLIAYLLFVLNVPPNLEYVMILPLLWAAFRFGQRGAVTAAFVMCAIALVGTLNGVGPFVYANPDASLLHVQSFMGTIALAALMLAAANSERQRAEQRLEVQDAVSRILVESPALKEAAPRVVQVLCERAGWDLGAVWNIDPVTNELRHVDVWQTPSAQAPRFMAATKEGRFVRGTGLPGRVRTTGRAVWIADVAVDENFKRAQLAVRDGLHGAFGFPIKLGDKILGVIECFSREIRQPDNHFLELVNDIGRQLGHYMERKRTEDLLRESEERLRAMIETAVDGIITIEETGAVISVNPAAEHIFGYTSAEMVGLNAAMLMPDMGPADYRNCTGTSREVQGRRRDGTNFPLELTVSESRVCDNRILTGIVRDITERKMAQDLVRQAQDELRRTNEMLEKRVLERTAELQQANAALLRTIEEQKKLEGQLRQAQKMEIIGTMSGGIAHDFNNILNIIQGYADVIGMESSTSRQTANNLKLIIEQIQRGASLVRHLLTVARKTETRLATMDANQFVLSMGDLIKQAFPKTIDISLELGPMLPSVLADTNQLSQALLNISVNARDAMPAGGKLTIKTSQVDGHDLRARRFEADADSYIAIEIADTGTGMNEAVQNRIFEPFFTTKGVGEGSGLGLAIVDGIIKEHNGFIDVKSRPGEGSVFHLYLPADQPQLPVITEKPMTQTQSVPEEKTPWGGGTILVVEDEQPMVYLLTDVLARSGYHVLTAMDGAEAIETFLQHKDVIDLVVLDLGLPKITGFEVLRRLNEENPSVRVIITSGYLEPDVKGALFQAGANDCLDKPYVLRDLVEKIASLMAAAEPGTAHRAL